MVFVLDAFFPFPFPLPDELSGFFPLAHGITPFFFVSNFLELSPFFSVHDQHSQVCGLGHNLPHFSRGSHTTPHAQYSQSRFDKFLSVFFHVLIFEANITSTINIPYFTIRRGVTITNHPFESHVVFKCALPY